MVGIVTRAASYASHKNWPHWNKLVGSAKGIDFARIGSDTGFVLEPAPNLFDFAPEHDWANLIAQLSLCDVVVGACGSLSYLASELGKKRVVFFSMNDPEYLGMDPHEIVRWKSAEKDYFIVKARGSLDFGAEQVLGALLGLLK